MTAPPLHSGSAQAASGRSPLLLWGLLAAGAIALSLLPAFVFQDAIVNPQGWPQFSRFWAASLRPDLSPALLATTAQATFTTLAYAACGSALSLVLGAGLGLLTAEVWWRSLLQTPPQAPSPVKGNGLRRLLVIPRGIHELVWGLILINVWGTDPITGIGAIALPFGLITGKVFAEILDETPRAPWQSLVSAGVSPLAAFCYGLLPQAGLNLVSYAFYRFECALRSAAVLGMIGVGGLGTEIQVSLQSLRYEQLWTFFYALVLLTGLVDWSCGALRRRLGCASRLALNLPSLPRTVAGQRVKAAAASSGQTEQTHRSSVEGFWLLGALLLGLGGAWAYLAPDLARVTAPRSGELLSELIADAFPPDWSLLSQLPQLALQTLAMSVLAIALASLGGTLLAFGAADRLFCPGGLLNPGGRWTLASWGSWALGRLARGLMLFARAIPGPVWALVLLYGLFPGILPGAIALGIHNLGILGRLQAEVLENLPPPPLLSLRSQGLGAGPIFCYGILPLTLPRFLAYGFYRWEVCLRETVIVGLVGAGGLGYLLREQISGFDYAGLTATLLGFICLTGLVDSLSRRARQALR